jgi:Protein of unknown function (DUF1553)/Protein of unknown function (DUF1549)/Planctomycete cytochrome C
MSDSLKTSLSKNGIAQPFSMIAVWMRLSQFRIESPSKFSEIRRVPKFLIALFCCNVLFGFGTLFGQDQSNEDFFERSVRPVFIEHCSKCHDDNKQGNGLRLDSRDKLLEGGDSGSAIVPGNPDESLLLEAIRQNGSLKMPPDYKLPNQQIEAIEHWIRSGAHWPKSDTTGPSAKELAWKNHWAFQKVSAPKPPSTGEPTWCKTPIDNFILAGLEAQGLIPSDQSDRRTLIRRATYSLWGIPPTPEAVERFVADPDPEAYPKLIDSLLESPSYGEQWARHWLDVARYSDTKGYVYAREERFFVHAPAYRDWVVHALNSDMPYDRFLLLQIAADQAAPDDRHALAAMGFLTLGRRFLGVSHDIIDDRIDVVTRGTMGLTASCARCHDHKYDPIPTADYYALYGVFQNCEERLVSLDDRRETDPAYVAFETELQKRQKALSDKLATARDEASARVRQRIADYLISQTELHKYPEEGFDTVLSAADLIPAFIRRIERYLAGAARENDTVFVAWRQFVSSMQSSPDGSLLAATAQQLCQLPPDKINPRIAQAFATPPTSLRDVADRYAKVFQEIDQAWQEIVKQPAADGTAVTAFTNSDDETLRKVLYAPSSPFLVPDESVVNIEYYFDSGNCTELWRLQGEVDRWLIQSPYGLPYAVALFDRNALIEPRIFKRGNPANKGADVSRHFLTAVEGSGRQPFQSGSGRLEMARAIIDPNNPLTARVWVNRIWSHHFGAGLVRTPSDFGIRAEPPSHPELLDYLATQLVERGWSTKAIHRMILLSATYQQNSAGPIDANTLAEAQKLDPQNRLLWRMNARRLSFEEMRDTALLVTGDLDLRMRGRAADMLSAAPSNPRRSLYGLVDRQFLPPTFRMFDFANPDLHIPSRSETTVPQQALFAMNHPFIARRARDLTNRISQSDSTADLRNAIHQLYHSILQRKPTSSEESDAFEFVSAGQRESLPLPPKETFDWKYGYGELDPASATLKSFQPLPHFTGTAWQGGSSWPDASLGWAQVTAVGGHPGNDLHHASVRRWIAPEAMTIRIRSTVKHEPNVSDGIRCHMLSSRQGLLRTANALHTEFQMDVDNISVQAGETIDFVVDILGELNSDQHFWAPVVEEMQANSVTVASGVTGIDLTSQTTTQARRWDATRDFTGPPVQLLTPLEQLAQVLLLSNEWMFVD